MSSDGEDRISIDTHTPTPTPTPTTAHRPAGQPHGHPPPRRRRRRRLRFMQRDGRFQVVFKKGRVNWSPFLLDIYTTLVEAHWRVMLLLFSLSYILSWLLFALLYWLLAYAHGDLGAPPRRAPCVDNVRGFTSAFLFSVETQATIGYGFRGVTESCTAAVVAVTVQDLLSCVIDTVVIGVAAAKMASASRRALTVGFSRCAVVNLRDGALCLSWRLGDFRGNHIVEGVARAQVVRYVTRPSGALEVSFRDLELQDRDVILATPVTIVHRLSPSSPLYRWRPEHDGKRPWEQEEEEVQEEDFELVVSFTYTGDTTGMLHQTRTSYAASDIRWGQRFQDMLSRGEKGCKVDYALFNQTTRVQVPMLSAEEHLRGKPPGQTSGSQDPRGESGTRPRTTDRRTGPGSAQEVIREVRL
ncbi:unnamed protein product [Lota lota]